MVLNIEPGAATIAQLIRYIVSFVNRVEQVLSRIVRRKEADFYFHYLYLESRTANSFLQHASKDNINLQFDVIYDVDRWSNGSGLGSTPEFTKDYREFLQNFFKEHHITSIADVGCGDWQFSRLLDFTGISYTGYDVARKVITYNQEHYQKDNISFVLYDGDFEQIKSAELLICKDVLMHLPSSYIERFIKILPRFKYALITNDINDDPALNNIDLDAPGGYRQLSLTIAPFNLKAQRVMLIKGVPGEAYDKEVLLVTSGQ